MNDQTRSAASAGGEFLSFTLGAEHYGVDILKVQEIRGYDAVTRVPDAPDYIKGVINLRGTIVPVIDLRLKLRLDEARYDAFTVMIVLNVEDRVVGIVVDSVSEVIPLNAEQIRPTPEFGAEGKAEVLATGGVGRCAAGIIHGGSWSWRAAGVVRLMHRYRRCAGGL